MWKKFLISFFHFSNWLVVFFFLLWIIALYFTEDGFSWGKWITYWVMLEVCVAILWTAIEDLDI